MAAPPVCPASCGLRLGAAVPFRPRYDALPPPPAWRPPPAPPSPAGSSPAASACRRPNPASRRRACLCRKSRPPGHPPPRRPPACGRPRLAIPPQVEGIAILGELRDGGRGVLLRREGGGRAGQNDAYATQHKHFIVLIN